MNKRKNWVSWWIKNADSESFESKFKLNSLFQVKKSTLSITISHGCVWERLKLSSSIPTFPCLMWIKWITCWTRVSEIMSPKKTWSRVWSRREAAKTERKHKGRERKKQQKLKEGKERSSKNWKKGKKEAGWGKRPKKCQVDQVVNKHQFGLTASFLTLLGMTTFISVMWASRLNSVNVYSVVAYFSSYS